MKKHRLKFFILVAAAVMAASAFAEESLLLPQGEITTASDSKRVRFSNEKLDAKIKEVVDDVVKSAKFESRIVATVNNGVVVLEGKIENAGQVEWIAKAIDRLPSVAAVVNRTETIEPPWTDVTPIKGEAKRIVNAGKKYLPRIGVALLLGLVLFGMGYMLSRFAEKAWRPHVNNPFLLSIVTRLTMLPIWALFFFVTLNAVGLSGIAATIVGGTGLLGIVLGFAFKGIAENYLSGILLAIKSPFTKGDLIVVDDNEDWSGTVENLSMRGTTITDAAGRLILIPNSIVIQSVIQNNSVNPILRDQFTISVDADQSVQKTEQAILSALSEVPEVTKEPEPMVLLDSVSAQTLRFIVYFWCDTKKYSGMKVRAKALEFANCALQKADIKLASPVRRLQVQSPQRGQENLETVVSPAFDRSKEFVEDDLHRRRDMKAKSEKLKLEQKTLPHEGAEGNLLK